MAVGRRPQFLTTWLSPLGCLSVLNYDSVLPPVQVVKEKKKEQAGSHSAFYGLFSEVTIVTSALFYLVISHVTLKGRGRRGMCEIEREGEHCLIPILLLLFGPTSAI